MLERILVLDLGGRCAKDITRCIRELGVFAELLSFDVPIERMQFRAVRGLVLAGDSVAPETLLIQESILSAGIPILGVCKGLTALMASLGGTLTSSPAPVQGRTPIIYWKHPLLFGLGGGGAVYMEHVEMPSTLPIGFRSIGITESCPFAVVANDEKRIYGIQFHPETKRTQKGSQILKNFLTNICGLSCTYHLDAMLDNRIEALQLAVAKSHVVGILRLDKASLSASALMRRVTNCSYTAVLIDQGLYPREAVERFTAYLEDALDLNLLRVDAGEQTLQSLQGESDAKTKQSIIQKEWSLARAKALAELPSVDYLIDMDIDAPSLILVDEDTACEDEAPRVRRIAPLHGFYEEELDGLCETLGIPDELYMHLTDHRDSYAQRIECEVTRERIDMVNRSEAIVQAVLDEFGVERRTYQVEMRLLPVQAGCENENGYLLNVFLSDLETNHFMALPHPLLSHLSKRIRSEVLQIKHVAYEIL